ncbi:hypothetical protein E4U55_001946, partial [Claviceps digitariae]
MAPRISIQELHVAVAPAAVVDRDGLESASIDAVAGRFQKPVIVMNYMQHFCGSWQAQ